MSHIPILSRSISIVPIEDCSSYFIVYDNSLQKQFKINRNTKELIEAIDNTKSIDEIVTFLNSKSQHNPYAEKDQVLTQIEELKSLGILDSNKFIAKKKKYIWLSFTLIPQNIVDKISSFFTFLFFRKIFFIFFICIAFLAILFSLKLTKSDLINFITLKNILLYIPLGYLSKFLHEFGHASAIRNYGLKPGTIGFGFYLLSPVFFADVTMCWRLKPTKRIIVNIAGMYFQILLSVILAIIYFLTFNKWFLITSMLNSISIIPNINPFIRYDGYWILSDLLGLPNLKDKSLAKLKLFLSWLSSPKSKTFPLSKGLDFFLFFYSIFNRLMIFVFVTIALLFSSSPIIDYPNRVFLLYRSIISCNDCSVLVLLKDFFYNNFFTTMLYLIGLSFALSVLFKLIKVLVVKLIRLNNPSLNKK